MRLVDSSGWIEYLADGALAEEYRQRLSPLGRVLTPTVVVYEIYKWMKRERSEEDALTVVGQLQRTRVVSPTVRISVTAADLSLAHGLAMADALVYATALDHEAELVTSDVDFEGLPGVTYLAKT